MSEDDGDGIFTYRREQGNKSTFQEETIRAIQNGEPLSIRALPANGDLLLANYAYKAVLGKLCEREGIPVEKLKLDIADNPNIAWGSAWSDKVVDIYRQEVRDEDAPEHFVQKIMARLGTVFDVPLSQTDLMAVPTPEKMNTGPLQRFDLETFLTKKTEIDRQRDPSRLRVVLVQSGSMGVKRLSDDDIVSIASSLKELQLPIDVWVVSDKEFLLHGDPGIKRSREEWQKIEPTINNRYEHARKSGLIQNVVIDTDINAIAAGLAGDYIITTDAFYSHLGFGAQRLAQEHLGVETKTRGAVLYTLYRPERWVTPGTTVCQSHALEYVLEREEQGPKLAIGGEWLLQEDYNSFFSQGNERNVGVNNQDVTLLINAATQDLMSGY